MRSKIMIVGPSGCGKSTIASLIEKKKRIAPRGSQVTNYGSWTMDMPSAYLEIPWMYDYLIASAQDASVVFFLMDPTIKRQVYPQGFAYSFPGIHVGVITRVDCVTRGDIEAAKKALISAGIQGAIIEFSLDSVSVIDEMESYKKYCIVRQT